MVQDTQRIKLFFSFSEDHGRAGEQVKGSYGQTVTALSVDQKLTHSMSRSQLIWSQLTFF